MQLRLSSSGFGACRPEGFIHGLGAKIWTIGSLGGIMVTYIIVTEQVPHENNSKSPHSLTEDSWKACMYPYKRIYIHRHSYI